MVSYSGHIVTVSNLTNHKVNPPQSLHPFLFKLALSRILFFRGKLKIAQANMFSGTGPSTVGGSGRSFPLGYWDDDCISPYDPRLNYFVS